MSNSFQRTVVIDHYSRSLVGLWRPMAAETRLPVEGAARVVGMRAMVVKLFVVTARLSDSKADGMCPSHNKK